MTSGIIRAEEEGYPSLAFYESPNAAIIPPADPVDLAIRLRGANVIQPPPANAAPLQEGTRQALWAANLSGGETFQIEAELKVVGEHVYMWVAVDSHVGMNDLRALAHAFDTRIYHPVRELWGSEPSPGIDGDPRLHILFTPGLGMSTAAYFARRHTFPQTVFPHSNEREMFFINLDAYSTGIGTASVESTLAHEFQHMIRANINPNEDTWLNEAFSSFTELYLGYNTTTGISTAFFNNPGTQLNAFGLSGTNRSANYGAGLIFMTYFYERFGLEAVQTLSADTTNGLNAVDNVLREFGEPGVNVFFADWILANLIRDQSVADGRYGYSMLQRDAPPTIATTTTRYPEFITGYVNQYASDYHTLTQIDQLDSLQITLSMPDVVPLLPIEDDSHGRVWYSNRGDASNMTLTRSFDLSEVESAHLVYDAWYEIEEDWDYAYVTISPDNGASWEILSTSSMTTSNPYGNAYGPGYTGRSNGWVEERISLDDYTGANVLIRFKMVTDDALNLPGLALDTISIPEIGYRSDFSTDGGGWDAAGWFLTNNEIPQYAWIQAVQHTSDDVIITRWLVEPQPDQSQQTFNLPLAQNTEQITLALSPFAPITTIGMPYTLNIAGNLP